jgi:hypothetical protein
MNLRNGRRWVLRTWERGQPKIWQMGVNLTILMITLAAIHQTLELEIMKMDEVMQIFLINLYV